MRLIPTLDAAEVSATTPRIARRDLVAVIFDGSLRRRIALMTGTMMIDVFSRSESVDDSVILSPVSSANMTVENRIPSRIPLLIVFQFVEDISFLSTIRRKADAIVKRYARRHGVLIVLRMLGVKMSDDVRDIIIKKSKSSDLRLSMEEEYIIIKEVSKAWIWHEKICHRTPFIIS